MSDAPMKWIRRSLPLAIFLVAVGFLFVGLFRDPREVPSPLIGKPAPAFSLAQLHQPERLAWLAASGDPYKLSIVDRDGRVGIDFGVSGVPETFVIDKEGIIRYKHIGPLTAKTLEHRILPLVRELQQS